jgi:hypothetical protein
MKAHTAYLTLHLEETTGFVNITPRVEAELRTSGIREGLVLVNSMHITSSVFINATSAACTMTSGSGWRSWRRSIPAPRSTTTTAPARTTRTRT